MVKKKGVNISRTSTLILLLAVVVAVLVGFGAYQYLNRQRTSIFVYQHDYAAGTKITKDMFGVLDIETSLYNAAASQGTHYASAAEINQFIQDGDVLLCDVLAYSPVFTNQNSDSGGNGIENRMGQGLTAVALNVERVRGLPNDLRIGSRLNLTTTYSLNQNQKETDLILQDIQVVDVVTDPSGILMTAFVEVEPKDSLQLIHAINAEVVYATVLKPGEYEAVTGNAATYKKGYADETQTAGTQPAAPLDDQTLQQMELYMNNEAAVIVPGSGEGNPAAGQQPVQ